VEKAHQKDWSVRGQNKPVERVEEKRPWVAQNQAVQLIQLRGSTLWYTPTDLRTNASTGVPLTTINSDC